MSQQDRQPLKQPDEAPPAYSPQQPGYGVAPPPNYPANGGYVAPGYQSGAPPGYQPMPGQTGPYAAQPGPYGGQPGPYGSQPVTVTTTNVVVVGGCPACRVGILEDDFTLLGVCCAILFFPLGILCCLAMRQRRCPNCGAVFG